MCMCLLMALHPRLILILKNTLNTLFFVIFFFNMLWYNIYGLADWEFFVVVVLLVFYYTVKVVFLKNL